MLELSQIENLAITGANGFVGKSIVEVIANLPSEKLPVHLTLITRDGLNYKLPRNINEITTQISQDLTMPWNLPNNISHFLNLAADGSRDPYSSSSSMQFQSISRNLVDWIRNNKESTKVFHASSGACFGIQPLNLNNPPIINKATFIEYRLWVEDFLIENSLKFGFELSIGRLFSFSGKNLLQKPQYALSNFISTALAMGKFKVMGDPLTQRSYLHQDSMSNWILKAIVSKESHKDLQIGSSEAVTIQQLAEFVAEKTSASVEYASFPAAGDIYIPNNLETRIKLDVDEGMHWKKAVLEMISEARLLNNG